MSKIIQEVIKEKVKSEIPQLRPGDTVKVHLKIREGDKERIQVYEGIVIKIRGEGVQKTFIVRKISYGVGVEKIFPFYSPTIDKIEVVKHGSVRRAKLYYLRQLHGKKVKAKVKERSIFEEKKDVKESEEEVTPEIE